MKSIKCDALPDAVGPYAHGKWAGDLLFISGQVGMKKGIAGLVSENIEDQAKQALSNLTAVLKDVEMTWENVVKANIYLEDMADYKTVNDIYSDELKLCKNMPARVCFGVSQLPLGAKVEIELIAQK